MNAIEIEEAITHLAEQPFNSKEFPSQFLEAFGNKETTIKRLRDGSSNKSDITNGVLQYNNIHIATCDKGRVEEILDSLRKSPATIRQKAKFILTTDGEVFQAEDLASGETVACNYKDFPEHFGFFLALAGISTVKEIRENSFDIRATSKLNRLYIELLKENPEWDKDARRHDMNHFMARLIFCFFAEDTNIFSESSLFTGTIGRMSERDASNTHEVISEIFRAMNTPHDKREKANIKRWANAFPYVNGGLFSGSTEVPKLSKIAKAYLLHVGNLNWKEINPDIFGSMIQAIVDENERGSLGMHYTSVPNILKVLNPLFLDELRDQLEEAGDNPRKLLNLRKRLSKIRVFDPACGSGNFLVIAYKEMRKIEAEINKRRDEPNKQSLIPLTNFRGIELRDFSAEIARLALIIAEYQCDVLYLGQKLALAEFLPLDSENWIICGNALRMDWLSVCPPTDTLVKLRGDDLFSTPLHQTEIDFENEGGETYICGNPPYLGATWQSKQQKAELKNIFQGRTNSWKSLDYVTGWFMKAADFGKQTSSVAAFVSTNSVCQGQQVPLIWPLIFETGNEVAFAYTSFKWSNLASHNAGVTVVIVGISSKPGNTRRLFSTDDDSKVIEKKVDNINAYLVPAKNIMVSKKNSPVSPLHTMLKGNMPYDGGHLLLSRDDLEGLKLTQKQINTYIRRIYGSAEYIRGLVRYCLWIEDKYLEEVLKIPPIKDRIDAVNAKRLSSPDKGGRDLAKRAHQMREMNIGRTHALIIPSVSSENRGYLPVGLIDNKSTATNLACVLFDAPLWNLALIASRLHLVWIATVCGKLETRYRYSNTLGWNTFPVPKLTEKNKADLTKCAEDILIAREEHFPATIADLYDPENMPENLRQAHNNNDEVLERIYIGRRFKNDTERLEKLFELYTTMTLKFESKNSSKSKGDSE